MKILIITALLLSFSNYALSKTFYLPLSQEMGSNTQIKLQNHIPSPSYVDLYIKRKSESKVQIQRIYLKALETKFFLASEYSDKWDISWIKPSVETPDSIQIEISYGTDTIAPIEQLSNKWRGSLNLTSGKIRVQNHSYLTNSASFEFFDKQAKIVNSQKISLKSFSSAQITPPSNATSFRAVTEYRSMMYLTSSQGMITRLESYGKYKALATKSTAYFLVEHQNPNTNKSFVISINDKEKIELARRAIREPANENIPRIISGTVSHSDSKYNHDWKAPNSTNWSWHLKNIDFVGRGSNLCDTNPQLIEEFLLDFSKTGQYICPWQYRITKEWKP